VVSFERLLGDAEKKQQKADGILMFPDWDSNRDLVQTKRERWALNCTMPLKQSTAPTNATNQFFLADHVCSTRTMLAFGNTVPILWAKCVSKYVYLHSSVLNLGNI